MKTYCILLLLCRSLLTAAGTYHVTVTGTDLGNGSEQDPWNLHTALNHPDGVAPGDTILVHGGTYRGAFTSQLRGTAHNPITVKAAAEEHPVLDGNGFAGAGILTIEGQYTWIAGLTITTSSAHRTGDVKDGVYFLGRGCKLINCIVNNAGGNGIGFWEPAIDSEIYGCIIYHNGTTGDTRGHGHGIYTQNRTGTKQIRNNIIFNSFGIGIQAYSESGHIEGFHIEANTFFNCGLPYGMLERHILAGGLQPADRVSITANRFYNSPDIPSKAMVQFGYSGAASNGTALFTGNIMVDGSYYCIAEWNTMTVTGNTLISRSSSMQLLAFDSFDHIRNPHFDNNRYHHGNLWKHTFDSWKNLAGQDINSTYSPEIPAKNTVFVDKNIYEDGRACITIYNWENSDAVNVGVPEILNEGDAYELIDVAHISGGAVATGIFNGKDIAVNMRLTDVELPAGTSGGAHFAHTAPHFGVFILRRTQQTDNPVSAPEIQPVHALSIYPNPAGNHITVTFRHYGEGSIALELMDSTGRIIQRETVAAHTGMNTSVQNISHLQPGLYFLSLTDGVRRNTVRIIRQ